MEDMEIRQLKVASYLTDEKVSLSKIFFNGSWKYLADPVAPLIFDLQYLLNTSVEFVKSVGYPEISSNGSISGIAGQVISGEADLGGDAAYFMPEWVTALTFLHPTHAESFYVYFKQPNSFGTYGLLLKPFSWKVWLAIITMWLILVAAVHLFTAVKNSYVQQYPKPLSQSDYNDSVVLWAVAAICSRSYSFGRGIGDGLALTLLTVCGTLFGIIISTIYSGLIVSSLTVKTGLINSFQDLIDNGYLIYGRPDIMMLFLVFAKNKKEALDLHDKSTPSYKSDEDSINQVISDDSARPGIALIEPFAMFYRLGKELKYSDAEMCGVAYVQTVSKHPVAMYVRKQSKLKEIINQKTLLVGQTGLKHRYLKHSVDFLIPRCAPPKWEPEPLSLHNLRAVIWFIVAAYIFVIFLVLMEAVFYRRYSLN